MLIKHADDVKDRTRDGRSATAEMRQLVDQVAKVQTFVGAHPNPEITNWQGVQSSLVTLREAFGLTP